MRRLQNVISLAETELDELKANLHLAQKELLNPAAIKQLDLMLQRVPNQATPTTSVTSSEDYLKTISERTEVDMGTDSLIFSVDVLPCKSNSHTSHADNECNVTQSNENTAQTNQMPNKKADFQVAGKATKSIKFVPVKKKPFQRNCKMLRSPDSMTKGGPIDETSISKFKVISECSARHKISPKQSVRLPAENVSSVSFIHSNAFVQVASSKPSAKLSTFASNNTTKSMYPQLRNDDTKQVLRTQVSKTTTYKQMTSKCPRSNIPRPPPKPQLPQNRWSQDHTKAFWHCLSSYIDNKGEEPLRQVENVSETISKQAGSNVSLNRQEPDENCHHPMKVKTNVATYTVLHNDVVDSNIPWNQEKASKSHNVIKNIQSLGMSDSCNHLQLEFGNADNSIAKPTKVEVYVAQVPPPVKPANPKQGATSGKTPRPCCGSKVNGAYACCSCKAKLPQKYTNETSCITDNTFQCNTMDAALSNIVPNDKSRRNELFSKCRSQTIPGVSICLPSLTVEHVLNFDNTDCTGNYSKKNTFFELQPVNEHSDEVTDATINKESVAVYELYETSTITSDSKTKCEKSSLQPDIVQLESQKEGNPVCEMCSRKISQTKVKLCTQTPKEVVTLVTTACSPFTLQTVSTCIQSKPQQLEQAVETLEPCCILRGKDEPKSLSQRVEEDCNRNCTVIDKTPAPDYICQNMLCEESTTVQHAGVDRSTRKKCPQDNSKHTSLCTVNCCQQIQRCDPIMMLNSCDCQDKEESDSICNETTCIAFKKTTCCEMYDDPPMGTCVCKNQQNRVSEKNCTCGQCLTMKPSERCCADCANRRNTVCSQIRKLSEPPCICNPCRLDKPLPPCRAWCSEEKGTCCVPGTPEDCRCCGGCCVCCACCCKRKRVRGGKRQNQNAGKRRDECMQCCSESTGIQECKKSCQIGYCITDNPTFLNEDYVNTTRAQNRDMNAQDTSGGVTAKTSDWNRSYNSLVAFHTPARQNIPFRSTDKEASLSKFQKLLTDPLKRKQGRLSTTSVETFSIPPQKQIVNMALTENKKVSRKFGFSKKRSEPIPKRNFCDVHLRKRKGPNMTRIEAFHEANEQSMSSEGELDCRCSLSIGEIHTCMQDQRNPKGGWQGTQNV